MRRLNFCKDWLFSKDGGAPRRIDLPHDAQLGERRGADEPSGAGGAYFAGGKYRYEKTFDGADLAGKAVLLDFGGVYRQAEVTLNGQRAGGCAYGYAPFLVDLTGKVTQGENVICVTADNSQTPNSRWYSGAGIYRPVWLWIGEKDHIVPDGIKITTLSYDPPQVQVETEICGEGEVTVEILEDAKEEASPDFSSNAGGGDTASAASFTAKDGSCAIAAGTGTRVELLLPTARLWSAEEPNLYRCRVTLSKNGKTVDTQSVSFGVRKLTWSPKGFFVNGKETLLRGGCVHHDNGILGAVTFREVEERKIKRLKSWGFNAIRSAHNPISPELLEVCDRLGMYVMDEMWDMWYRSKTACDYALDFRDNWEQDIENTVRRDRCHPSVVLYSIGNEVTEPGEEEGTALSRQLVDTFHRLDPTRPVTAGINLALVAMAKSKIGMYAEKQEENTDPEAFFQSINSADYNKQVVENGKSMNAAAALPEVEALAAPTLNMLDIAGYNYGDSRYPIEGREHPDRILVGSETFPMDIASNWAMVEQYPYLVGDFMWTAWDYLGESGIGAWVYDQSDFGFGKPYPWLTAGSGVLDILGDDTAEAGLAAAVFEKRKTPYIGVCPPTHPGEIPAKSTWRGTNAIPSWSWRGCEGNEAQVEVYTAAQEVELFLNGESVGRKAVESYLAAFEITYLPGNLTAVTYENGKETGRATLTSADGKLSLRIAPEEELIREKPAFLRVGIAGENGSIEANSDCNVTIEVSGADLLAFGSACPKTEASYLNGDFPSYYGRAMAVIVPREEKVQVRAKTDTGMEAKAEFDAAGE